MHHSKVFRTVRIVHFQTVRLHITVTVTQQLHSSAGASIWKWTEEKILLVYLCTFLLTGLSNMLQNCTLRMIPDTHGFWMLNWHGFEEIGTVFQC